jgi:hypothetical protein
MLRQTVLFEGTDASGHFGLWESNGTADGTYELTGVVDGVFNPANFVVFNGEVVFQGQDASGLYGIWVTDSTTAGTTELGGLGNNGINGASSSGLLGQSPGFFDPDFTMFNGELLFQGVDASGHPGLWLTNGTAAGTSELGGLDNGSIPGVYASGIFHGLFDPFFTVLNGEVLFEGIDAGGHPGLWMTNGTAAGTTEIDPNGAASGGLFNSVNDPDFTVLNGEVLFEGLDADGADGLWVTTGTVLGTTELGGLRDGGISHAGPFGIGGVDMTVLNGEVLWTGVDSGEFEGLWESNGTTAGTHELTGISGANALFSGLDPMNLTALNGEVLFDGYDTSVDFGLWATDGTAAGTHELTGISGANANLGALYLTVFTFNGAAEALFNGLDAGLFQGLWVTNGTAAGTSELVGIDGASKNPRNFPVVGGQSPFSQEVLFNGTDASGHDGLWVTNGTSAGTSEITGSANINPNGVIGDNLASVTVIIPPPEAFTDSNTSDVLFLNTTSGDTWVEAVSKGAFNGWDQIGGSNTSYGVAGTGDFYGTGGSDVLFRNNSTGDTWFEAISNGAFAGWHQIGGSDTSYSVAGLGDFSGYGTSDILFRDTSTGDTWFEAISNGAFNGWHQIGGSDTHYSVVGVGDFFESGIDDILFRNNSTGDTWIEAITNGASAGWNQIGGSDTHYSVAGVGDFFGNGTDDILFRNNSTGDTWFEAITNGAFAGWHQISASDTTYAVVGVGDYFGNNTSDILFRNSAGDTWVEQITNGAFAGWSQIGGSNTSYSVPITVGPPALT